MLAPLVGFKVDDIGCSTTLTGAAAWTAAFGGVIGAAWTGLMTATGEVIFNSVLTTTAIGAATGLATAISAGAA
jgi:hypothetical protein